MKVLHVVDSLNPGGMENGVLNMAHRLSPMGVQMHIACLAERGAFADKLPIPSAVTVLGKSSGFSLGCVIRLARLIALENPDVIHTHNLGPLVYAAMATLGGKTVPILHGEHGQVQPQELSPRRKAIRRLLYRACHTVHTVSTSLLDELPRGGFTARRMTALVNGVDCDRFQPTPDRSEVRLQLGLPANSGCVLGIVGRFVALKRHGLLLDSLRPVMAANPSVHLVVVGDNGSERDSIITAMNSHPNKDRIHWLGMRSDMDRCYQAMNLLVSPSEIEGLSNAVLEAMAAGVPVLAHNACGNNEVLRDGENGLLRDLHDVPTLSAALQDAISDPNRLAQLGTAARNHVLGHFSIDSMARAYFAAYQSIAAAPGGAA